MADSAGVLGEIVRRKRADVAARLGAATLADLRARAAPTRRSLAAVLRQPGARFVMEVKRASPSEGAIRSTADPAAIARSWSGTADAISVLTDTPFFGGSLDDLAAVRSATDAPVLAKDFVIDPRQVAEARIHGADAVLVMLSVLDDAAAAQIIAEARRFGMDALVEAHDEPELRRAIALGAPIIGINNRDLKTLTVDLAVTERLAHLVPADRLVIAESGIGTRADVDRLAPYADAFLVGSSLMRAPDPAAAARALAFGRVKVCGLTSDDDARAAAHAGATYGGLILVGGSPRHITLAQARIVADALRAAHVAPVAVFRDSPVEHVAAAAAQIGASAVQLHGREDARFIARLRPMLADGTEIWAAAPVERDAAPARAGADRTLFDTAVAGQSGGTGSIFDWSRIADRDDLDRSILAGGLTPGNARAASNVGAHALDVNSGVETAPGQKNAEKLAAFFAELRPLTRSESAPCV